MPGAPFLVLTSKLEGPLGVRHGFIRPPASRYPSLSEARLLDMLGMNRMEVACSTACSSSGSASIRDQTGHKPCPRATPAGKQELNLPHLAQVNAPLEQGNGLVEVPLGRYRSPRLHTPPHDRMDDQPPRPSGALFTMGDPLCKRSQFGQALAQPGTGCHSVLASRAKGPRAQPTFEGHRSPVARDRPTVLTDVRYVLAKLTFVRRCQRTSPRAMLIARARWPNSRAAL